MPDVWDDQCEIDRLKARIKITQMDREGAHAVALLAATVASGWPGLEPPVQTAPHGRRDLWRT